MCKSLSARALLAGLWALAALWTGSVRLAAQAHEHGVAEVGIAVDGKTAQIEFTAPGSAIMGFEHAARSAADKKKMTDAFAKFKNNAAAMFLLDADLGCTVTAKQIGTVEEHNHDDHQHEGAAMKEHDHGHADVRALVDVACRQNLEGNTVRFEVKRFFPDADTLRVQVVGSTFQTGAELKGNRNTIRLSR